jgi:hypothetical protein
LARGHQELRPSGLAVPGDDDGRVQSFELLEHGDPAVAVDVHVVRREPREDREAAALDEIAGEQDTLLPQEDDLVAARVRKTERAQLGRRPAEADFRAAFVDHMRLDELDPFELLGDRLAERPEHLEVTRAFAFQLVELLAVVQDDRAGLERLRAVTVLGMEVRDRQQQRPPGGQGLGMPSHRRAVLRAHPRVDHEHRARAGDDADVRDERYPPVGDDVHALGDLRRLVHDHRCLRSRRLDLGHRQPFDPM